MTKYIQASDKGENESTMKLCEGYDEEFFSSNVLYAVNVYYNSDSDLNNISAQINDNEIAVTGTKFIHFNHPETDRKIKTLFIAVPDENYKKQDVRFISQTDSSGLDSVYEFDDSKIRCYDNIKDCSISEKYLGPVLMTFDGEEQKGDYCKGGVITSPEEANECFKDISWPEQFISPLWPDQIEEYKTKSFFDNNVLIAVQTQFSDLNRFICRDITVDESTIKVSMFCDYAASSGVDSITNKLDVIEIPRSIYNNQKIQFDFTYSK